MVMKAAGKRKPLSELLVDGSGIDTSIFDVKTNKLGIKQIVAVPEKPVLLSDREVLELHHICRQIDHKINVVGVRTESLYKGFTAIAGGKPAIPATCTTEAQRIAYMFKEVTNAITNPPKTKSHLVKLRKADKELLV